MRILTRYILREVVSHALLGGALFTFVLFMRDLGRILELAVRGSASITDVARVFAYTLPSTLTLTIPMAVLVGILLGFSRFSADSEVTAMRASGFGVMQFIRVVSIAAVFALFLGLANSLYIAPQGTAALLRLENTLKTQQASFEVQPRVFYEDFKNYVLYVQDTHPAQGASLWRHVFLADLTQPATPHIVTSDEAVVVSGPAQTLRLHLRDGSEHDTSPQNADRYDVRTFSDTDVPIQAGMQEDTKLSRLDAPIMAMSARDLWSRRHEKLGRQYLIELNKRFSYPFACLVLMLVGVPLGLSSRRGGKSTGFVLTILLVFIYYFFSSTGVAMAKQGKISPYIGVWSANIIFAIAGILLLRQLTRGGFALGRIAAVGAYLQTALRKLKPHTADENAPSLLERIMRSARRLLHTQFPLTFDDYVMREFLLNLALVLFSFIAISLIFNFFELTGDIIRNRTPLITVGDYLLNLIPFMLYNLTPLCTLIAVLVTFGALNRTSEMTAMKASGISLYRIIAPVLVLAALISAGLFAFDEFYLPQANRRQEALRSSIKGKPAQTFLRPDRKWMSGEQNSLGEPTRIFYYQFFDPDKDVFANLTVFEFHPGTFALQKRIFATSAHWNANIHQWQLENGWVRDFNGEAVSNYQPFTLTTFPEIREEPGYFKKESRQSQEMSYGELQRYVHDLKQSGFDTVRLRVQLNHKLAYPLITLVMAVFAVPFALSMGKKGSLAGIAVAVGMAIAYSVLSSLFESMGNVNALPPMLAAWSPDLLFGLAGSYLLLRTPT